MDEQTQLSQDANIALIRSLYEAVFQQGNLARIATLFAADFLDHTTPDQLCGPLGVKDYVQAVRSGFPDMQVTVEEAMAQGEYVCVRTTWHGTHLGMYETRPPSGRQVIRTLLQLFRVVDGRITEEWNEGAGLLETDQKNSV